MAPECPADLISLSVPLQIDVQCFSMTPGDLEVSWKSVQNILWCFQRLALRAAPTVAVTKAPAGINTHGGHDGNERDTAARTAKHARQSPRYHETPVHSAARWLEMLLHTSLNLYRGPGGRHVAVMSRQGGCGQTSLTWSHVDALLDYLKAKRCF